MKKPLPPDPIYYAGIGSRETPPSVLERIAAIGKYIQHYYPQLILRSGGATGADSAFAKLVKPANKQIFPIWDPDRDERPHLYNKSLAEQIARDHHPAWDRVGPIGKLAHTRNSYILLGPMCDDPVKFVCCWTQNGHPLGGTGQGIRLCADPQWNIPVFNLAHDDAQSLLDRFLRENFLPPNNIQ